MNIIRLVILLSLMICLFVTTSWAQIPPLSDEGPHPELLMRSYVITDDGIAID